MVGDRRIEAMTKLSLQILKLNGLLLEEGDRITDDINITTARWRILGTLVRAQDSLTVPQIAREMGQARQSVQRIVDAMVKDKSVEYRINPDHAKSKKVCLTQAGLKIHSVMLKRKKQSQAFIAEKINFQEIQQASAVMQKIIEQLNAVD